jgi:hypothetical protein
MKATELRKRLSYDAATGIFSWRRNAQRTASWNTRYAGVQAGCMAQNNYFYISLDKRLYLASRLAWLYVFGKWPHAEIDHINRDPSDNRIENLREATRAENTRNCRVRSHSVSGIKGVAYIADKQKWNAKIRADGKTIFLGYYDTAAAAQAAHRAAAKRYHGAFAGEI